MIKKIKKGMLMVLVLTVISSASFANVYAADEENSDVDESQYSIVLEENSEEIDTNNLFEKAKEESENGSAEKDENNNIIYKTTQNLAKYKDDKGGTLEKFATTSFQKVETNALAAPSSSQGDGKWDTSSGAYMYSTIYYTRITSNNKAYVKLDRCEGSVSQFNSGVQLWNLTVTTGQVGTYSSGTYNQSKTEDFARATSFTTYPDPSWQPVEAIFGSYGSIVGCTMTVKLGRSSDRTWTDTFSNNIR